MAIVDVQEIWSGRKGTNELGGEAGEGAIRRYTRVFRVQTDDQQEGPQRVMAAKGLPSMTDYFITRKSTDTGSLCHHISANVDQDDWKYWLVTCEYSSDSEDVGDPKHEVTGSKGPGGGNNKSPKAKEQHDPTQDPPKTKIHYERCVRRMEVDLDGNPMTNSSKEPFDPPIEVEDLRPVIQITKKVESFDPADPKFRSKINKDDFMGFPPGMVLLAGVNATDEYINDKKYTSLTYEFHIDPRGWIVKVLDMGLREKLGPGKYATIPCKGTQGNGEPKAPSEFMTPVGVPLGGNGKRAQNPFVHSFHLYRPADFGKL